MKKIAVFGKPGGGKSTFCKNLSECTGIEFHSLDLIEYRKDGTKVPADEYKFAHEKLISADKWIIDGLGPFNLDSFWARIEAADTLVYIDLPYFIHYWWTTKRLVLSLFKKPVGWPEGSSVLKGTITGWKYLKLSPRFWNTEFFDKIKKKAVGKKIHHITKVQDLKLLLKNI